MPALIVLILVSIFFNAAFAQQLDTPGLNQEFIVKMEGLSYTIKTTSNFNIIDIKFDESENKLTVFIESGAKNNLSELQIPVQLIHQPFVFLLNDQEISPTVKQNELISFITVKFPGDGKHTLEIIGESEIGQTTDAGPLMLQILVLILVLAGILVLIYFRKKYLKPTH